MTPAQVSPTTVRKMSPAADTAVAKKKNWKCLKSLLDMNDCRYFRNAHACSSANTPGKKTNNVNFN